MDLRLVQLVVAAALSYGCSSAAPQPQPVPVREASLISTRRDDTTPQVLPRPRPPRAERHYQEGLEAYQLLDMPRAVVAFRAASLEAPGDPEVEWSLRTAEYLVNPHSVPTIVDLDRGCLFWPNRLGLHLVRRLVWAQAFARAGQLGVAATLARRVGKEARERAGYDWNEVLPTDAARLEVTAEAWLARWSRPSRSRRTWWSWAAGRDESAAGVPMVPEHR